MIYTILGGGIVLLLFIFMIVKAVMTDQPKKLEKELNDYRTNTDAVIQTLKDQNEDLLRRVKTLEEIVTSPGDLEDKINSL